MQSGWPKKQKDVPVERCPYYHLQHELSAEAPLLLHGSRVLVPVSLHTTLMHLAHEGYQGIVRTKQRLHELYWWPHMDAMVSDLIKTCTACQMNDKPARTYAAPVELPQGPFQKVAVDVVGPGYTRLSLCHYATGLLQ